MFILHQDNRNIFLIPQTMLKIRQFFRNAYMQIMFAAHANLLTVDQRQQASEAELNAVLC